MSSNNKSKGQAIVQKTKPVGRAKGFQPMTRIPKVNVVANREVLNANILSNTSSAPEFITVTSGNDTAIPINPGNSDMFPWLSVQANQYQRFRFRRLRFSYISTVKEFATAGQQGRVFLAFQSDPSESVPNTVATLETLPCALGAPSAEDPIVLDLTGKLNTDRNFHFVSSSLEMTMIEDDPKLTYPGLLLMGAYGCANGGSKIGEVVVDYEIELLFPTGTQGYQASSPSPLIGGFDFLYSGQFRASDTQNNLPSGTTVSAIGNTSTTLGTSVFGLQDYSAAAAAGTVSLQLGPGNYLLYWSVHIQSSNAANPFLDTAVSVEISGATFYVAQNIWGNTIAVAEQPWRTSFNGVTPISISSTGTIAEGKRSGQIRLLVYAATDGAVVWSIVGSSLSDSPNKYLTYMFALPI